MKGERGIIIETSSPYYRAIDASSPGGAARLHGSGSKFSSSVLLLSVDDHVPSSNFKFLEAKIISSNESLFEVDGNGMEAFTFLNIIFSHNLILSSEIFIMQDIFYLMEPLLVLMGLS